MPPTPAPRRRPARHALLRAAGAALLIALLGAAAAQPRIVVTLPPYVDLLERLAGPDAEVAGLLPAGASPHDYDPSPRTLVAIERADLVVANGGLDAWALDLVAASGGDAAVVVVLDLPGAHPVAGAAHAGDDPERGDVNPHVWLDPLRMRAVAPELAAALAAVDPAGAERYRANAAALQRDLAALDAELREILAPVAGATFVPFHDAWPYFAERYDLELAVEIEPFPGREPTPSYLAEVLALIRDSGTAAIFAEAQLPLRPAEVVADEAGVALALLDPLGGSEALRGYEALLRYNAETIANALGDGAP